MELKVNLHFHSKEDASDKVIEYTAREGIDRAAFLGFGALAITHHRKFFKLGDLKEYAASKGILLISGAEIEIRNQHVVVLNCDEGVEKIKTFEELENYKKNNPNIFILAAHPYFHGHCLYRDGLNGNTHIFDAIEFSWFYTKLINLNKKAERFAQKNNMPFVATSDTHFIDILDKSYIVLEAEEKTEAGVFKAIRQKKFINVTSPRSFWKDMVWKLMSFKTRSLIFTIRCKLNLKKI
ncbi:MAG: PHP-associated domain-containing protein [Candidatus Pacebacteria bacterium]|nr:PHP-associated domain-containing protein [Candidatus Paceibacterota bacterium]